MRAILALALSWGINFLTPYEVQPIYSSREDYPARENRNWAVHLTLKTRGCEILYVEIYPPGQDKPVLARRSDFIAQWQFVPKYELKKIGDTDKERREYWMYSIGDALRELSQQGYWKYVVVIRTPQKDSALTFWLTPLGVAYANPGPPPKTDIDEEWNAWIGKHAFFHGHFKDQFTRLWEFSDSRTELTLTIKASQTI